MTRFTSDEVHLGMAAAARADIRAAWHEYLRKYSAAKMAKALKENERILDTLLANIPEKHLRAHGALMRLFAYMCETGVITVGHDEP